VFAWILGESHAVLLAEQKRPTSFSSLWNEVILPNRNQSETLGHISFLGNDISFELQ
jgi:hypothetical protein